MNAPMGRITTQLAGPTEATVDTLELEVVDGPCAGQRVKTDDEEATIGTATNNALVLDDPAVSRYHVALRATPAGIEVTDRESTNGTFVGQVRVERAIVRPGTILRIGRSQIRVNEGTAASVDLFGDTSLAGLYGGTANMRRLMSEIARASGSSAPVVILGESGTGKELVARALHDIGGPKRPFVTLDCGALQGPLLASELFGHERGAFTGAERTRKGAFELADGGTLFLDEIGELPVEHQPALLGALERRRFKRIGGSTEIAVNVRVVAATHRDLPCAVNQGGFRLDLYYRLAVVVLRVPALRDRLTDLPELARRFAATLGADDRFDECMTPEVLERLGKRAWPGNVRELRNYVEAALVMGHAAYPDGTHDSPETHDELPGTVRHSLDAMPEHLLRMPFHEARSLLLSAHERQALEFWLREADGNVSLAARNMGLNRTHLYTLLARNGLPSDGGKRRL